jgi:ABC-type glycerol-3-phosphate transport system permease component
MVLLLPYIYLLWLVLTRLEPAPEIYAPPQYSWGSSLLNSLVPGLAVWIVQLPVALLTAYTIALRRLPGKATNRALYLLFVIVAIVGTGVVSAPLFSGGRTLGLIDTVWASVLPVCASGAAVILFALFFESLAPRLAQARAQGEAETSIFRREILPAAWPLVLLVGVASTWWASQRLLWPLLVLMASGRWPASLWARRILEYTGPSVDAGIFTMFSVFPIAIPCAAALVFLVRVILRQMALVAGDE